jgi:hypothetical protein
MKILSLLLILNTSIFAQGVGINESGAAADASAILDVSSTTQGFLPPRMTQSERDAITNPAAGLMIFNTSTNRLNYYNGTVWESMEGVLEIEIGDTYAGGIVFYIDGTGSHGLVAASFDQTNREWGCQGDLIPGADGTAVGTGAQNTADIVAGCPQSGIAAKICNELSLNGYDDWFLPSRDELNLMYTNLHVAGLGGFASYYYWSSTEGDDVYAIMLNFSNGTVSGFDKSTVYNVRAVRSF